ncbi:MAG TPA: IclR family transcriptional regulator C-terminal domain-containing protein [Caldimonas sp.]
MKVKKATRDRGEPQAESSAIAGDPNFMASLARGLRVLRAFSEFRRSLTIAQVSQATGMPRAAARRCLYTLKVLGYVEEDERRYSLRPQVLTLGHAYLSSTPLAVVAQPYLDEVSRVVQESSSAAILDGDDIVYICRSAEKRILSISLLVGTRLPAYCTALGHVLLAHLPADRLEAYLQRVKLVARTDNTITSVAKLRKAIAQVQKADFALLDQELEVGLRSIAVPVRDHRGVVVAAINVGSHASRFSVAELERRCLPVLHNCADEIGKLLLG